MWRKCGHRVHLLILSCLVPHIALIPAAFGDPASHRYLLQHNLRRLLISTKLFFACPDLFLPRLLLWLTVFEVELSTSEVEISLRLMLLYGLLGHEPLMRLLLGVTQLSLLDLLVLDGGRGRKHHKI